MSPGSGQAGTRPGPLARLGRDTRGAIGVPGVLVAAMLVGATALPVANVNLKADNQRMEDAAAAAGLAATGKMRAAGGGVSEQTLRQAADLYARLNLLDLPPDARRKALQSLDLHMTTDTDAQTVQVDLSATLPGRNVVTALLAAAGADGATLPEKTTGTSRVQCISDKVELVLAIDMTKSMNAQIEQTGVSGAQWPERIEQTVAVAAEMVDNIQRLCSDLELKVGIVPWASTVKIPDGQEKRWKDNGWIDRSRFTLRGADQDVEAQQWGGCLEDRLMNTASTYEGERGPRPGHRRRPALPALRLPRHQSAHQARGLGTGRGAVPPGPARQRPDGAPRRRCRHPGAGVAGRQRLEPRGRPQQGMHAGRDDPAAHPDLHGHLVHRGVDGHRQRQPGR